MGKKSRKNNCDLDPLHQPRANQRLSYVRMRATSHFEHDKRRPRLALLLLLKFERNDANIRWWQTRTSQIIH